MLLLADSGFIVSWEAATVMIAVVAAGTWHGAVLFRLSNALTGLSTELKAMRDSDEQNRRDHEEFRTNLHDADHRITIIEQAG